MDVLGVCPTEVGDRLDLAREQPLGIAYVMNYAIRNGHNANLVYRSPTNEEINNAEVIALSLLTKDVPSGLDILRRAKELNPNIKTVIGGHHISGDKSLVLEDCVDFGVVGEGEETFVELLSQIENRGDVENVEGIIYKRNGVLKETPSRGLIELDGLRPLRDSDFDGFRDNTFYSPAPSERRFVPLIGTRGCTKGCEFCTAELVWGKSIRYRSPQDIEKEIQDNLRDSKTDIFFFDDENILHTPKKARPILENLIGKGYNLGSCGDIRTMSTEMANLMGSAGYTHVYWGVESVNPSILSREKRGSDIQKVRQVLSMFEEIGISNIGMIMMGFDYETEEDILKTAEELPTYPIHQLRLSIATPFPGTPFYHRLKKDGTEFDPDFSKWDTGHLVYGHPSISPERMQELHHEIVTSFYKSPQWDRRMTIFSSQHPRMKKSVDEFRSYVSEYLS